MSAQQSRAVTKKDKIRMIREARRLLDIVTANTTDEVELERLRQITHTIDLVALSIQLWEADN